MTGLLREARLSRFALRANVASLLAEHAADDLVCDVRADAYGHGLGQIVAELAELGLHRFRVSPGVALASGLTTESGPLRTDIELAPYGFAASYVNRVLEPVLSLVGEVVAVKGVAAGSAISYGYTYRTDRASTIALVGLGYADGVPRLGSSTAHASVNGELALIAGRIAMDQFVLDCGDRQATVGDDVIVWGASENSPGLRDWAAITRRSPQALTAGLGRRVSRRWINGGVR